MFQSFLWMMRNRSENSKTTFTCFLFIAWKKFFTYKLKTFWWLHHNHGSFWIWMRKNISSMYNVQWTVFSLSVLAHINVHMSHNHNIFFNRNWIELFCFCFYCASRHLFVIIIILFLFFFVFQCNYVAFQIHRTIKWMENTAKLFSFWRYLS